MAKNIMVRKKTNGVWSYNIHKPAKVLKCVCNCKLSSKNSKLKCKEVKEEERLKIFEEFWELSKNEKQLYIKKYKNYTKKIPTLRLRDTITPSRRSSSIQYYLQTADDRVRVCKVLFLNTIGISEKVCLKILSHKDSNNSTSDNDIDDNFNTTENALNISNSQRSTKTTVSEKKSFL